VEGLLKRLFVFLKLTSLPPAQIVEMTTFRRRYLRPQHSVGPPAETFLLAGVRREASLLEQGDDFSRVLFY
jgi:hypothetical protein